MTTLELMDYYGGYWRGEHPDHPISDWRYEVSNGDTRAGYWNWLESLLGMEDTEAE